MIEKLIELDFDMPSLQKTTIILNQANRDSVTFRYKIYKGANEVNYSAYIRAELLFRKRDGTIVTGDGVISASGITYLLHEYIFDIVGEVQGYVKLFTDDSLSATLHYGFNVISNLVDIARISKFYIGTIEDLVAELNVTVEEARRILEELQKDAFVTIADFNAAMDDIDGEISGIDADISGINAEMINKANLSIPGATSWDSGNFPIESGLWSPTVIGSTVAGTNTYTQYRTGYYYKIGRMVITQFTVIMSTKDVSMAGLVNITGLPFASRYQYSGAISRWQGVNLGVNTQLTLELATAINAITLKLNQQNGAYSDLNANAITNSFGIVASVIYEATT